MDTWPRIHGGESRNGTDAADSQGSHQDRRPRRRVRRPVAVERSRRSGIAVPRLSHLGISRARLRGPLALVTVLVAFLVVAGDVRLSAVAPRARTGIITGVITTKVPAAASLRVTIDPEVCGQTL